MRKPDTVECLYLDFDSFFASVEEQARPALRGRPIGVPPFLGANSTCVIAANRKAKAAGVRSIMQVKEARRLCPDLQLVPQSPDLYERAHRKLVLLIEQEIPIDAVCSIDELVCRLQPRDIADPLGLGARIKERIRKEIGPYITCSIGIAANRQLAKIASEMSKPDGLMVLAPEDMPGPLLDLPIGDVPGIGSRMKRRLIDAGIWTVEALWQTQPKQMRALWGNVTGERFWYALHGYDVHSEPGARSMFGHGRVLPPEWRDFDHAFDAARLLAIKAARRLRRSGYLANTFGVWLKMPDGKWSAEYGVGGANDDRSAVQALALLWQEVPEAYRQRNCILRLNVALYDLVPESQRQSDLFQNAGGQDEKWAKLSNLMDATNRRYSRTVVSVGPWTPPPGGYAGGKIAFSRVPDLEDFW